jgi:hypothetical protein
VKKSAAVIIWEILEVVVVGYVAHGETMLKNIRGA